MDAYRFCESRSMSLFKPDTKAKNMFLAKVTVALDQPVLFDLYRFGNKFEFQYGYGSAMIPMFEYTFSFVGQDTEVLVSILFILPCYMLYIFLKIELFCLSWT